MICPQLNNVELLYIKNFPSKSELKELFNLWLELVIRSKKKQRHRRIVIGFPFLNVLHGNSNEVPSLPHLNVRAKTNYKTYR
jgi:hypothetical protein